MKEELGGGVAFAAGGRRQADLWCRGGSWTELIAISWLWSGVAGNGWDYGGNSRPRFLGEPREGGCGLVEAGMQGKPLEMVLGKRIRGCLAAGWRTIKARGRCSVLAERRKD